MQRNTDWRRMIWDLIDDSADQDDSRLQMAGLDDAIRQLALALDEGEDSQMWYALGYARYRHPDRMGSSEMQQQTASALRRSLALDPEFQLARLYLVHHFYDLAAYETAAQELNQGDPSSLDPYIALKWSEMGLCCSLRLRGLAKSIEEIDAFVEEAREHPREDIAPFNLARALECCVQNSKEKTPCRIVEQMRELDRLGGWDDWLGAIVACR